MPTIVDDAIVLRCWEFSETSQTIALFCRAHGMLRGLAKGSRREKSPFSGGFEALTRGQIVAIIKPATELATLTEWDLRRVYWASRRSWDGHRAALYLVDAARHAITDADPHPALFDALHAALLSMESAKNSAGALGPLLAGQWALLVETGYRPMLRDPLNPSPARERGRLWFNPESGAITARPTPSRAAANGQWPIRAATAEALRALAEHDLSDLNAGIEAMSATDERTLLGANRLLAAYLREVLGRDIPAGRWLVADSARGSANR